MKCCGTCAWWRSAQDFGLCTWQQGERPFYMPHLAHTLPDEGTTCPCHKPKENEREA